MCSRSVSFVRLRILKVMWGWWCWGECWRNVLRMRRYYHVCVRRRCVHVSGRVVFVSFVRCMSVGIVCTLPRRQR